jgi:hypothetical protein
MTGRAAGFAHSEATRAKISSALNDRIADRKKHGLPAYDRDPHHRIFHPPREFAELYRTILPKCESVEEAQRMLREHIATVNLRRVLRGAY